MSSSLSCLEVDANPAIRISGSLDSGFSDFTMSAGMKNEKLSSTNKSILSWRNFPAFT